MRDLRQNCVNRAVFAAPHRLAMPIAVYPGLALTGAKVQDIVTNATAQCDAQIALHERYRTPFVLSAMDLSVEAEAFGCTIHKSENEVPSVLGRLVTNLEQAQQLAVPKPGDKRTSVYLETVRRLRKLVDHPLVIGGCIGPFSLAARLAGMSEAMELTITEPDLMHTLVAKSASFLTLYLSAFKEAGADGAIMAEPAAGLLSPRSMGAFSSAYIREIESAVCDGHFALILHNCAAKPLHLPSMLETGLGTFHFGALMDLPAVLGQVAPEIVLCGNLDPTSVFCQLPPLEIAARTANLLAATAAYRNYVISSGCDVPPNAPLTGLDAFFNTVDNTIQNS
ncbi:MAG: uroporphyrinogen decarboxylase family protein [Verrucomicrobiia bacterium]|jgi:uroporphyrinogen decarboxylase